MPILALDRRRRGALARPHRTFLPLLPSCRAIVQVEMRSYCVHDALLWRQDAAAAVLSPSTSDVCIALAIMQGDRSSRDALEALMVLDALFGVRPPPSLCSRRPHRTFIPLSPSCKAGSFKTRCARCVLMVLDALSGVGPSRRCALDVDNMFIPLAIVQSDYSSRDALLLRSRCSMPFFGVRPPPLLCSRRPHRTFVPRSRHHARRSFKSRRARCALMVLDALFGVGPPPPLRSCRPHRTFVPLLPLSKA